MTDIAASLTANPLWQRARAMFARALAAIGAIGAIAALETLSPDVRRQIVAWLAPLEHIVRKLLLAEAAKLHQRERVRAKPSVRIEVVPLRGMAQSFLDRRRLAGDRRRSGESFAGEDAGGPGEPRLSLDRSQPQSWCASLSFALPANPDVVSNSHAPRIRALWGAAPPPALPPMRAQRAISAEDTPFRLARRLEALRRVLENPLPHAERLAHLLARAVRRFPEIVRRYLFAPARANGYDKADPRLAIDALREAWDAPEVITDSS
jgi:hypothetical protein